MPFLAPLLIPLIVGGAGAGIGSLLGGIGGGGDSSSGGSGDSGKNPDGSIKPQTLPAMWPDVQKAFGDWLFGQVGGGSPAYTGALTPDPSTTRLPQVWESWQPWDGGMSHLAEFISGGSGLGKPSPYNESAWTYGGMGGPGHQRMNLLSEYGAPSQAGQYVANMAQFGVSSEGAGRPLQDLAYGKPTGAAQYMMPFLAAKAYRAPAVGGRR